MFVSAFNTERGKQAKIDSNVLNNPPIMAFISENIEHTVELPIEMRGSDEASLFHRYAVMQMFPLTN